MQDSSKVRYRAPALDKGLDILELLCEQSNGMTRAEIVKAMGRSQSEIYRMLERLVARDYVTRSLEGDRYALSMKLLVLANQHPPVRRLVAQAMPHMDAFARAALQSCHLVAPDRGGITVVAQASCPANWEFGVHIGARLDVLTTGSGQTLLAFQDDERRAEILSLSATPQRMKLFEQIKPDLEAVRKAGYRISDSLQIATVKDISVPILSAIGGAVAVLTCPYIQRLEGEPSPDIDTTLALLQKVADQMALS